ncbi:MAG: hypothetical protein QGF53_08945 [Alphaproteobacteria bacterium]|nr:hypothetical protein [Alphaproteobacteria bacterium]
MSRILFPILVSCACLVLGACGGAPYPTSDPALLDRYGTWGDKLHFGPMEPDVCLAASVVPKLSFPARIGIARIDTGTLTTLPPQEAEAWQGLADRLGPDWGELVPVSPMLVELVQPEPRELCQGCADEIVKAIRLGAARQHLDVVLIYEVTGVGNIRSNPFAATYVTILGLYLTPSRNVSANATAQALIVDVRNGYPYGYATVFVEDAAFRLSTWANDEEAKREATQDAKTAVALALVPEVEAMARDLRRQVAEIAPASP